MSMGNYLGAGPHSTRVATTPRRFGIAHVTVVPTNYDPDDEPDDDT